MKKPASAIVSRSFNRVPAIWSKDVETILITEADLAKRIKTLAQRIEKDYAGKEMVIVSLLNGTVMFLADLIRNISLPLRLDFIGVSSYGVGTESGDLVFTKELRLDVHGRDVLLVDDILDTGRTVSRVLTKLRKLKPHESKLACCSTNRSGAWKKWKRITSVSQFQISSSLATDWIMRSAIATCRL